MANLFFCINTSRLYTFPPIWKHFPCIESNPNPKGGLSMTHIQSLLHNRAFIGVLVFTLLAAGIGGYALLADRPVTAPTPSVAETPAPKPVPTVEPTPEPREELAALPLPTAVKRARELAMNLL